MGVLSPKLTIQEGPTSKFQQNSYIEQFNPCFEYERFF
jgi:hypothetical protein